MHSSIISKPILLTYYHRNIYNVIIDHQHKQNSHHSIFLGRAVSTGLQFWLWCPVCVPIYKCKLRQPEQTHMTAVTVKQVYLYTDAYLYCIIQYFCTNSTKCTVVTLKSILLHYSCT